MLRTLVVAAVLCFSTLSLSAQIISESVEVRVTNVDVVVTDRAGNPIQGLTKDDFELFENGKLQPITNFYEVRDEWSATPEAAAAAAAASPEAPLRDARRRRVAIFIDNYSIPFSRRADVFRSLLKSLDTLLQPGDEAALITWNRSLRVAVPFTDDRQTIQEAVEAEGKRSTAASSIANGRAQVINQAQQLRDLASGPVRQRVLSPQQAYERSASMVRQYAEEQASLERQLLEGLSWTISTLSGMQGKKVIVYVGAELPEKPALDLYQEIYTMYVPILQGAQNFVSSARNQLDLAPQMRKVATHASAVGITMYMVEAADRNAGSFRVESQSGGADMESDFIQEVNTRQALNSIAEITGGIAIAGSSNYDLAFNTVAKDLSSYYSLGYRARDDAGTHGTIVVKVKRDGAKVRSRHGYATRTADEETGDKLISSLFHERVKGDFPIQLSLGKPVPTSGGKYQVDVVVRIPSSLTLLKQDDKLVGEMVVWLGVGNAFGEMSNMTHRTQPLSFPLSAEKQVRSRPFEYQLSVIVKGGEQVIAVGVVDSLAKQSGYARARFKTE